MTGELRWSITLIGLAIAISSAVGVFLPAGHRWAILLPMLAGIGVGIAGLAIGTPDLNEPHADEAFQQVFLDSSIGGFVTVLAGLAFVWLRAQPTADAVRT